jgi:uncharacterized protein (TIGR03118 family)
MAAPPHPTPQHPATPRRVARLALVLGLTTALLTLAPAAHADPDEQRTAYHQTNLVSDVEGLATLRDTNLVNAWGMAAGPTTPMWVADNGTDKSTLYNGAVNGSPPAIVPLVVNVPGAPTGIVFNTQPGFTVSAGGVSAPARFIFDTEDGTILGWAPNVPLNGNAQLTATVPDAIYKGLATATNDAGTFLYAANFHDNRIDVFDSTFSLVHLSGDFRDRHLPDGFAPFNVQQLGGNLYVSYAKQDAERSDEVAGHGLGFVDVFDTSGNLLRRLISHGHLNAPWGMVIAPEGFGQFSGDLLVGNFGDGRINAYDRDGDFEGSLRDEGGRPIEIDGLWALRFGNGVAGSPTTLMFSAGIDDEAHGLFGSIEAVTG